MTPRLSCSEARAAQCHVDILREGLTQAVVPGHADGPEYGRKKIGGLHLSGKML